MSKIKAFVIPSLVGFLVACGGSTMAQDAPRLQSVEFKQYELPEESKDDSLHLVKKEQKKYDEKGRVSLYSVYLANPIGEIVKSSETAKEWDEHFRSESVSNYDEMGDILTTEKSYYSHKKNVLMKLESYDYIKAPNEPLIQTYTYTESGKPDKITILDKDDKKLGTEEYKYSKDDEEIQYKKSVKNPDGSKYYELKKTKYTDKGSLAERSILIKDDTDTYKEEITFERNKIKEHLKYKNGELISQFGGSGGNTAKYDPSKSRVMMDFGSDAGGGDSDKPKAGSSFGDFGLWGSEDEYDDNDNKIKTTQTTDGVVTQITEYTYDEKNNLTGTVKTDYNEGKETNVEKEIRKYDDQSQLLQKEVFSNGVLISKETYDYIYE